ncbi:hypothetical protein NFI96_013295, partial [Prochilodus magdalenae]
SSSSGAVFPNPSSFLPAYDMTMNLFKSGEEMLRWTIVLGRFTSVWKQRGLLPQSPAAISSCRHCTGPPLWSRRTLPEPGWIQHHTRSLCQGETLKPSVYLSEEQLDKPPPPDLPDVGEVRIPFYRKLQQCLSPSDVLDLVDGNTQTHRHISNSLTRMWETTKKMSDEQRRCELRLMLEHPGFAELCHRARMDAPRMHCHDLAYTLLAVVKLGVSQSSLVVQTLLRVIQVDWDHLLHLYTHCLFCQLHLHIQDTLTPQCHCWTENRPPTKPMQHNSVLWAASCGAASCGAASCGAASCGAASCGQRPVGQRPVGQRPVGSVLWAASCGQRPVGQCPVSTDKGLEDGQHCTERLNQFDEKSLSVLSTCLEDMEGSKNAEALKQGLKLLLEDRIPEIQNVMLLQTMMRFLGKDTSPAVKKKLEMKALAMAEKFTLPNAQYMLNTLATMHLNSRPLLDICSKRISENVHSVPFARLLVVLKSCRQLRYRNYSLFSSISDYLTNTLTMWSNKQLVFLLLEFEGLRFRPAALLDAFAERVIQKPDRLALRDLLSVLKAYSSLNHALKETREPFLDSVTRVLESYLPKISSADLLKAVSCLCVLEHFPQAPLETLLQKDRLDELLQRGSPWYKGVQLKLHTLGLCLRLDSPPLPPTVSPIPDLQDIVSPGELPVNPGLLSALKCLVGEADVRDSVVEEGVYFIDSVITLTPEARNVRHSPDEQSGTPQNPRRIAVLCAPPSSFCFGTTHPRGRLALKMRHLRMLGYEPVLVPVHEFDTQTNQERTEALKTFIFPEGENSREFTEEL